VQAWWSLLAVPQGPPSFFSMPLSSFPPTVVTRLSRGPRSHNESTVSLLFSVLFLPKWNRTACRQKGLSRFGGPRHKAFVRSPPSASSHLERTFLTSPFPGPIGRPGSLSGIGFTCNVLQSPCFRKSPTDPL